MIKKILKSAVILLSAGVIASPAFAAEWGVSGQVRVDWDIHKTIDVDRGDDNTEKLIINGVDVIGGDTWVSFNLTDENAKGALEYYADGRRAFVGSGSASEGAWTAIAKLTIRDDSAKNGEESPRQGTTVNSTKSGDQTVELAHDSGFSFKLGFTTPLDTYRQGRSNLLIDRTGSQEHVGASIGDKIGNPNLNALDNRSDVATFGYKVGDALTVGLAIEQNSSNSSTLGKAFQSVSYGGYGNTEPTTDVALSGAPATNIGLKVNFSGPVNVGVVFVTGSEAGDEDLGGNKDYTASASAFGLGVGLNLGAITPYLNLWNPSSTSENHLGSDETASSTTQIGADIGPFGLSLVTGTTTYNQTMAEVKQDEIKIAGSTLELGYNTNVGGSAFKVAYASISETRTQGDDETTGSVSWIKLRLQQSF